MKKIFLLFLIIPFLCKAQDPNLFPIEGNKIVYKDSTRLNNNFSITVKTALNAYANNFNSQVVQSENKMNNYIFYEDSETILSNLKFVIIQSFASSLWHATASFKKHADSISYKIYDINMEKMNVPAAGTLSNPQSLEDFYYNNKGKSKKMFMLLNEKIEKAMDIFKSNLR
jgi:hypothetical protein